MKTKTNIKFVKLLYHAKDVAINGGYNGLFAGFVQVILLMWLRTTVNYQYRYGISFTIALKELYKQGGITRFYNGLIFAIIQGSLAKFGSLFANEGSQVISTYFSPNVRSSLIISSILGSIISGGWRIVLMPIDSCKTILQVNGKDGFSILYDNVIINGNISLLYQGSLATFITTMFSHYPWFYMHNYLDNLIKKPDLKNILYLNIRSALIGFISSIVSDTCSNFIRVIKIVKQSGNNDMLYTSYFNIIMNIYNTT
jgi:hypothetical protein